MGKNVFVFNPRGMTESEYRKKLSDAKSDYIPMSEMLAKIEKAKERRARKERLKENRMKDGGIVKKRTKNKKKKARTGIKVRGTKFKGIF